MVATGRKREPFAYSDLAPFLAPLCKGKLGWLKLREQSKKRPARSVEPDGEGRIPGQGCLHRYEHRHRHEGRYSILLSDIVSTGREGNPKESPEHFRHRDVGQARRNKFEYRRHSLLRLTAAEVSHHEARPGGKGGYQDLEEQDRIRSWEACRFA